MLKDNSPIEDLAHLLAESNGSLRMRWQSTPAGSCFVVTTRYPGGAAMFSNMSLGNCLGAALAFLTAQRGETPAAPEETVDRDPEGAHVGPAPQPDPTGTAVGYVTTPIHCAVCGFGEEAGAVYRTGEACPNCDTIDQVCTGGPNHEGNHSLHMDSGENRIGT